MKKFVVLLCFATTLQVWAQRQEKVLTQGWQFSRDKVHWEAVNVPHDWAIKGPFDKHWDIQTVAIEQNGETKETEKTGRSGALPWLGEGYYKIVVPITSADKHVELVFDGAMSEAKVFVNGNEAGQWAYGYNAFNVDITPYLKTGDNLIEVNLNNVEQSSRWYPGGGIYRPVKLITTNNIHLSTFSPFAYTLSTDSNKAVLSVGADISCSENLSSVAVDVTLRDKSGVIVASKENLYVNNNTFSTTLNVEQPNLWSPETPYLYKLNIRLSDGVNLLDEQTINVGLRSIEVSKDGGFCLNGQRRKIKGVCLHHDLGPLGAAINKSALIRQIKMLKEMGCDAIRTAHNMPSEMQMDICDSLGMMVMAESFDMWVYPKCKNGYARFFNEWWEKDLSNLVKHHRNHPSIIMWSIGNEIVEQSMPEGKEMASRLQELCHQLDPSRPVTQGMDRVDQALKTGFAQVMDIPGFNYRVNKYQKCLDTLPQGFLLGSETASTVSSRGVYKFPVKVGYGQIYDDGQCSSYDTEYCSWSNLPDDDWRWQDDESHIIGEFVWTGYDYLGEPTPYDEYWPSRSSYFGICDLAGLPKDRWWLYRSKWSIDHTIHLLPHWNWPEREGEITPVYCYTDGMSGELFVNGKSQGRVTKDKNSRLDRYRLRWNDVIYEQGEIKVVVYDRENNMIGEQIRRTATEPKHIVLDVECPQASQNVLNLKADGDDLAFITVSLTDKDGNFCPTLDDNLSFEVTGEGSFVAACNGDPTSLEPFTEPNMKLFNGQLVVIVRSTTQPGIITLKVKDLQRKLEQRVNITTIATVQCEAM